MDTIGTLDMWKVFSRNKLLCCLYKHIPAQKIIDVILDEGFELEKTLETVHQFVRR